MWGSKCRQLTEITKFMNDSGKKFKVLLNEPLSDVSNFKNLVHTLKGVAGNLGLITLMELLDNLEYAEDTKVSSTLSAIKEELAIIVQLLAKNVCKQPKNSIDENISILSVLELKALCEVLYQYAQNAELNDELIAQLLLNSDIQFADEVKV